MSTTHRLYPVAALFLALSFLGAIATPRDCKADSCSSTAYAQEFEGGNGSLPAEWATGTGDFGASTGGFYGSLLGFGSRFIQNKTVPPLPCILRLTNLPPHNRVDVDFLLAIINSWDGIGGTGGGDAFHVTVNGSEVFSHIFGLGTGSSDYYPPAGVFMGSSGWNNAYNMYLDPVFHGIPDSSSTLEIRWYASGGPNQPSWEGGDNESWAIDHVRVVLHSVNLPTSLSLTSALNPSIFGEPVSLTATLTPSNASGTVGFFVGAAPVPFATSPVVGGVATTSLTGLAIGTTTILARYAPDSCYGTATSALLDQVVAGFALSTSTSGPGTITKTPDQAAYLPGAVVQLTAIPAPGWADRKSVV